MTTNEELLKAVSSVHADVLDSRKDVRELYTIIKGDGTEEKPGLAARTLMIEKRCKDQHSPGPWAKIAQGALSTVLAAVILAVLGFGMGLFKTH